jgi:hypothetical protein
MATMTRSARAHSATISEGALSWHSPTRGLLCHHDARYNNPGLSVCSFGRF